MGSANPPSFSSHRRRRSDHSIQFFALYILLFNVCVYLADAGPGPAGRKLQSMMAPPSFPSQNHILGQRDSQPSRPPSMPSRSFINAQNVPNSIGGTSSPSFLQTQSASSTVHTNNNNEERLSWVPNRPFSAPALPKEPLLEKIPGPPSRIPSSFIQLPGSAPPPLTTGGAYFSVNNAKGVMDNNNNNNRNTNMISTQHMPRFQQQASSLLSVASTTSASHIKDSSDTEEDSNSGLYDADRNGMGKNGLMVPPPRHLSASEYEATRREEESDGEDMRFIQRHQHHARHEYDEDEDEDDEEEEEEEEDENQSDYGDADEEDYDNYDEASEEEKSKYEDEAASRSSGRGVSLLETDEARENEDEDVDYDDDNEEAEIEEDEYEEENEDEYERPRHRRHRRHRHQAHSTSHGHRSPRHRLKHRFQRAYVLQHNKMNKYNDDFNSNTNINTETMNALDAATAKSTRFIQKRATRDNGPLPTIGWESKNKLAQWSPPPGAEQYNNYDANNPMSFTPQDKAYSARRRAGSPPEPVLPDLPPAPVIIQ